VRSRPTNYPPGSQTSIEDVARQSSLRPEAADVGRIGRRLIRTVVKAARQDNGVNLAELLAAHLGPDLEELPVVGTGWPTYEHVNVQIGLEHWLAEPVRTCERIGISQYRHRDFSLGDLAQWTENGPTVGNTALVQLATGPNGEVHDCVRCALYLVQESDQRIALLLREADLHGMGAPIVRLEALARRTEDADRVLREIGDLALLHNVFRGQVLSFGGEMFGPRNSATLNFLPRPSLSRSELVLPAEILALIERQVVGIAQNREILRAAGQHLKRGILLHGAPGTGKTHTIRYLLGQLQGVTVVILSGNALAAIAQACSIARVLQPAAVIVEDVDLIAEQRGMHPGQNPLLFQLLNEMDGLGEDVDVAFLLTTNRPDLLEPALAARPGRVDQAIEIPLPDATARRELIELYRGNLHLDIEDFEPILERTAGVTASFLKELLRRAAMVAVAESPGTGEHLTVDNRQLQAALDELLNPENQLTRSLLGGVSDSSSDTGDTDQDVRLSRRRGQQRFNQ
jgi:ATPase family associated with various cellular activities (AAA)